MAESLDPKELVTVEDLAVSSMWEMAALVEVLEKKGVFIRQELYDVIPELRKRYPDETTLKDLIPKLFAHHRTCDSVHSENYRLELVDQGKHQCHLIQIEER